MTDQTKPGPYASEKRGGYFICVDTRSGAEVSYPTTKRESEAEARTMNTAYAEALAELAGAK